MRFGAMHDPGLIEVTVMLTKDQSLNTVRDIIYKTLEDVVRSSPLLRKSKRSERRCCAVWKTTCRTRNPSPPER